MKACVSEPFGLRHTQSLSLPPSRNEHVFSQPLFLCAYTWICVSATHRCGVCVCREDLTITQFPLWLSHSNKPPLLNSSNTENRFSQTAKNSPQLFLRKDANWFLAEPITIWFASTSQRLELLEPWLRKCWRKLTLPAIRTLFQVCVCVSSSPAHMHAHGALRTGL